MKDRRLLVFCFALLPALAFGAEAEEHKPGIINIDWTLLLQIVNFLILVAILYKFLFKPLQTFLAKRAEGIRSSLEEAKRAREEAERLQEEFQARIQTIQREAQERREAALREVEEERQRLMRASREEAERLLGEAKTQIEAEVKRAKAALREEVVSLSLEIAEQILQRSLTDEDHRRLSEQFVQGLAPGAVEGPGSGS